MLAFVESLVIGGDKTARNAKCMAPTINRKYIAAELGVLKHASGLSIQSMHGDQPIGTKSRRLLLCIADLCTTAETVT